MKEVPKSPVILDFLARSFLDGRSFHAKMQEIELAIILSALEKTDNNRNQAAKLMGLNRTTLVEKLRKHGLLKTTPTLYTKANQSTARA